MKKLFKVNIRHKRRKIRNKFYKWVRNRQILPISNISMKEKFQKSWKLFWKDYAKLFKESGFSINERKIFNKYF